VRNPTASPWLISAPSSCIGVRATYTDEARRRKVKGVIVASAGFEAAGTVGEVSIIRGLGSGLDENAVRAARQVLFLPAVKDGAFVKIRASLEFTFNLY
jgi:TonB family protein